MALEGKVGVVTGSAKGIGYGITEALLQKGAKTAVIRGSKMAMECMSKEKGGNGGVILNVASLAGLQHNPREPVYAGTKHAVIATTRSLAMSKEVNEKNGIKWVLLCPSLVDTPLIQCAFGPLGFLPKELQDTIDKTEGHLSIAEIGAAAMRLLDDDVESGSALVVGKVRGQYFYKFDD